jgi:uncharacterized protein (TIGR02453 family)
MTEAHSTGFPTEGLQFLKRLKRNNNREWFADNKATYEESVKKPMHTLVEMLASEFEKFAPEIQASPKTSLYRIHRDTRFSKDKSPYKTHAAAVFSARPLGKHEGAGFYFHIAPAELLIGGGLYMAEPEDLQAVREAIAANPARLTRILQNKAFRRMFGELTGQQLTRVPRGFAATHPAADYLRYKQFLAARTLPSEAATSRNFARTLVETFKTLHPFIQFLNEPILAGKRTRQRQESLLS